MPQFVGGRHRDTAAGAFRGVSVRVHETLKGCAEMSWWGASGHGCQGLRWSSPCDHDECKGVPELVWRWHGAPANGAFGDVPSGLGNI